MDISKGPLESNMFDQVSWVSGKISVRLNVRTYCFDSTYVAPRIGSLEPISKSIARYVWKRCKLYVLGIKYLKFVI